MTLFWLIEDEHKVQTRCIIADFTGGPELYDGIAPQLAGLEIGVLGKWSLAVCVGAFKLIIH